MEREKLETLIGSVALGDRKAFNALYDETSAKLLGVCLRILGKRSAAETALQDTFIQVWKNADRFATVGYGPMTWLITLARNTSINHKRGGVPTLEIRDYTDAIAATRPHDEVPFAEDVDARRITKCFADLEPTRRDAIKGAYLDGLTYPDLAEKTNVPLKTMRTWLRRGLISLREDLSQ